MPCRNRSRSSGVMCCQRSAIRRRKFERWKPWRPSPPNRIRHSNRIPSACQKVIRRQPKSVGSSQFQSCCTISVPMAIRANIPSIANGAMKIIFFHLSLIFSPSGFRKFVVNRLQTLAQMEHRIAFAREQRIHADAGLGGNFLEAAPFEFVPDKHFALLIRQLIERQLEFIEENVTGVKRLRSSIGRSSRSSNRTRSSSS